MISAVRIADTIATGANGTKEAASFLIALTMSSIQRITGAVTGREHGEEDESQTANGLPDRLVLFFPAKTVFVELKAPGKVLRPLQRKRRCQLKKLGFPVLCIDSVSQIQPAVDAILTWTPGTPFPEGIGAKVPDLEMTSLPDGYESRIDPVNPIGGSFL